MGRTKKIRDAADEIRGGLRSAVIEDAKISTVAVVIAGTAPLILNAFSQKAVEEMLKKHMGLTVAREKKNPRECLERATPRNESGHVAMPPTAFKRAMITAAGSVKSLKMNRLRTQLYLVGQSVPIRFKEQVPRMDMVRTSGISRAPDVRFRPQFNNWEASLIVQFDDTNLDVQMVLDLIQRAGHVGVGEFRPERNGNFGTFRILSAITDRDAYAAALAANSVPMVALQIPDWALDADIDPELLQKIMGSQTTVQEDDDAGSHRNGAAKIPMDFEEASQ